MKKNLVKWFLAVLGLAAANFAVGQNISEFTIPSGGVPFAIAVGPDGSYWFTEKSLDNAGNVAAAAIGRITTAGVITEFSIPASSSGNFGITAGPDGNLWFTETFANRIARITTAGVLTEFAIPTAGSLPQGIVTGPDGNLWFAEQAGNKIGQITTSGVVIGEFTIPTPVSNPSDVTVGLDGNIWFTEQSGNNVGRITTSGVITEFAIPTAGSIPHGIAPGPDGNLWFVEGQGNNIGRITTAGLITEFPAPLAEPLEIVAGPDGNLWFAEQSPNIGRITTAGVVTEFPAPAAFAIAAGLDGNLWLTEQGVNKIARITTGPCVADASTLCLNGSRFRVQASWQIPSQGRSGQGTAVAITGDTGYFWFFGANSVEVVVKILNGCLINGHYWVFAGGLTNVEVTLTVTDVDTGGLKTYINPSGTAFQPIQDTSAFAACPP